MKVLRCMDQWRELQSNMTSSVGFVPTMGALHEGHLSLLRASAEANAQTVLSIYVNATQFNDAQDFAKYPSTLEADLAKAKSAGVDVVLLPDFEQMYSDGFRFQLNENEFSNRLCGTDRPGHFTGVLTVVMKLLNLVRPNRAYFGLKDFQQYTLIKDMCETFFLATEIIGCPIVREADGLAMSSRNALLDVPARRLAGRLNTLLASAANDEQAVQSLQAADMSVAYVETVGSRRCAAVVIRSGDCAVRLIDNVAVSTSHLATELKGAVS